MLCNHPPPARSFINNNFIDSTLQQKEKICKSQALIEHHSIGLPIFADEQIVHRDKSKDESANQVTKSVMTHAIEPEEELKKLVDNEAKLNQSGYYRGYLSWQDAFCLLKKTKVGTFLIRDSEQCNYLYSLSVQTKRGPTSCRIEYQNGLFRLDSAENLTDKMPRFDSVTDLVEYYVYMTKNLSMKASTKDKSPVWLDLDEDNKSNVPVQIYNPLYKEVRSLQHMCRVNLMKLQKEGQSSSSSIRTNGRTNVSDLLPTMLRNYLKEYPYSQ